MRGIKLFNCKSGIFDEKEYKREIKREQEFISKKNKELKEAYKKLKRKRSLKEKEIKKNLPAIKAKKILTKKDYEKQLYDLSDKYDKSIIKAKKIHRNLKFYGLTNNGLKEIKGESEKQRNKRILKAKKIYEKLKIELENNEKLEKEIKNLNKKIIKLKIENNSK